MLHWLDKKDTRNISWRTIMGHHWKQKVAGSQILGKTDSRQIAITYNNTPNTYFRSQLRQDWKANTPAQNLSIASVTDCNASDICAVFPIQILQPRLSNKLPRSGLGPGHLKVHISPYDPSWLLRSSEEALFSIPLPSPACLMGTPETAFSVTAPRL